MGGSCFCENEMADYLAALQWDFAVLELGINMIGVFPVEEFERRSEYMVSKVLETGRTVFLVTHYPHFRSLPCEKEEERQLRRDFYNVFKRIYEKYKCEKLVLIDGSDVLTDFTGLTCDLIHPSDYGHSIMGDNLARFILKTDLPLQIVKLS
jgi:lysophospholipase L1-like esterase